MKKILIIILVLILNILFLNNTFSAELSEEEIRLGKIINSAGNSYKNVYQKDTPEYDDAKKRYDDAIAERDALRKKETATKNTGTGGNTAKAAGSGTGTGAGTASGAKEEKKVPILGECGIDVDNDFGMTIGEALDGCLGGSDLVNGVDAHIDGDGGLSVKIKNWVSNIALFLGVFAVGAIVFGGLMMTLSSGEEEKIKKAKDVVKWGIIGFIGIISAAALINLVVKIMYSL